MGEDCENYLLVQRTRKAFLFWELHIARCFRNYSPVAMQGLLLDHCRKPLLVYTFSNFSSCRSPEICMLLIEPKIDLPQLSPRLREGDFSKSCKIRSGVRELWL